ncbi:MAG: hypothetical protein Q8L92_11015, partial [Rubrivivax sp.]|nr:hypothetical protein [Rubrivivax sp.]
AWSRESGVALVCVGAAGGKSLAHKVDVDDLADVSHDPLLASLRQRLRKQHGAPGKGPMGLRCVFSRESVRQPAQACDVDGSLNCHGYGSTVTVTATFGMVAAGEAISQLLALQSTPALAPSGDFQLQSEALRTGR